MVVAAAACGGTGGSALGNQGDGGSGSGSNSGSATAGSDSGSGSGSGFTLAVSDYWFGDLDDTIPAGDYAIDLEIEITNDESEYLVTAPAMFSIVADDGAVYPADLTQAAMPQRCTTLSAVAPGTQQSCSIVIYLPLASSVAVVHYDDQLGHVADDAIDMKPAAPACLLTYAWWNEDGGDVTCQTCLTGDDTGFLPCDAEQTALEGCDCSPWCGATTNYCECIASCVDATCTAAWAAWDQCRDRAACGSSCPSTY